MQKNLFSFIVLSTVLLAGCASDSPDTANPEPSMLDALDDAGVDIDPVLREIMELEEKRAKAQFTVTYDAEFSAGGDSQLVTTTEYQDGAARKRTDTSLPGLGESRTYILGDRYITCSKFGNEWTCSESDMNIDFEFDESDEPVIDTEWDTSETEQASFERDGTMDIAGVTATCFKADFGNDFSSRQCLSDSGVVLYMETMSSDGSTVMRATSYKATVASSDFELPAEPVVAGSPEAQENDCRNACEVMELTESECDDVCAMQSEYAGGTVPEGTEGDWSDTDWE